jgi:hypothetical protein
MSFDSIGGIGGDRRADALQFLRGSCFIHQCARIFAQGPIAAIDVAMLMMLSGASE